MSSGKQQEARPLSSGKQQEARPLSSRVMSCKDPSGGAVANNGSFRVYYSLGAAGSVPFVWETKPGTPKSAVAPGACAGGYDVPPVMMISPPPSYQSRARKAYNNTTRRTTAKSSSYWPPRWLLPGWMARWLGVRSRLWPPADGDRWLAPVDSREDDVQGRRPRRRAVLMCF